jgi:putative PIN family toxin of toxin-antitoxin system
MIRAVIDTNIFVSSFFGGNPRKIIDLWKNGAFRLCLSPGIVDEYIEVLYRLGLDKEDGLDELLRFFADGHFILFTQKTPDLKIVAEDPDDDKFIECAVALDAMAIISGDKVLIAVENYMGIRIMSPKVFLDRFDSSNLGR